MKFSSKSLGSRLQHNFFYYLVKFKLTFLARFFLAVVIFYYSLMPSSGKRSQHYIERRFPNSNKLQKFIHTYKIYSNFANLLFDRMLLSINSSLEIKTNSVNSQASLQEALKEDEGCIILSGHVGSWQLGLLEFENTQRQVNLVQLVQEGDNDKHYFQRDSYKGAKPIKFISPADGFKASIEISAALNRNEIVCMMGDRVLYEGEKFILMPFLGGKIPLPLAPFSISSITQKPLIITFSVLDKNCIRGVYAKKIHIPYGIHKKPELLAPYVQNYIEALEFMVEEYPHQFFNFYNLWEEKHDN